MNFNFANVLPYLPELLRASLTTVELVLLSSFVGIILGVLLCLLRLSRNPLLQIPSYAYIFFFRGTPLLVQIFLIYYGLGQFTFIRDSWLWVPVLSQAYWCAIIALTLNTAAYIAEIMRGAIRAIPTGEIEAAQALGMSPVQIFTRITLPRAFGIMLPAYSNEMIFLLKGSALVSTITVMDIMHASKNIIAKTYLTIEIYIVAGVLYLFISWLFMMGFYLLERSINNHKRYQVS